MAKTTQVYFDGIWEHNHTSRIFRTIDNDSIRFFWGEGFENGILTVDPSAGCTITEFAKVVAGCFNDDSNFATEVLRAYDCDENATFAGIRFEFNGVTLTVSKENADAERICEEWNAGMEANAEKYRLEMEEYMKTPQYRAKRAKALKLQTRREIVEKEVLAVDESTELELKDDEAKAKWEQWVEINSHDSYSLDVVKYARRWAKYMQHLMTKHNKSVYQIAHNASHVTNIEGGVTGFMYGCAVAMLSECWKYGEELRFWHNKKWGREDCDGVVNPAVLTLNVG
jgi:hypothetical protein